MAIRVMAIRVMAIRVMAIRVIDLRGISFSSPFGKGGYRGILEVHYN
jgi:hypothetical protein